MSKPRLHIVSLPHTQTTAAYSSCAYSQKVRKGTKMWRQQGYEVVLYGSEVNDAECDEHVTLVTEAERAGWFGDGFDTVLTPFEWDANQPYWKTANERAIRAIAERCDKHDLLLLIAGFAQEPIARALPFLTCAEWGVGYEGILPGDISHHAFESAAWMHWVYGKNIWSSGVFYDRVIPNFFDVDEFPRLGAGEGEYVMFLGRLIPRKGPEVALQIAERLGKKLIVAGPGALESGDGYVLAPGVELRGNVEYVGELGIAERCWYLERAEALLTPTLYIEPFGGVAVEAMMCGTPVVATDFGAFTETVEEGLSGYRFHTLKDGAEALTKATELDRAMVQHYARSKYSLEAVGKQFDDWFMQLDGLWEGGWDS